MGESLGLSLGLANLVAAREGSTPVVRTSVLTVYDQRPSEVGLPEENPNAGEPGLVMRGFVERVGDRAPLVAADGTKFSGEALTVEALEVMARKVGYGSPVTVAVPAYWSQGQYAALRAEFFAQPTLAPNGVAPALISDATAALTALRAQPGFPANGIVALCDFGAGGTSVTLTNAGANFQQVGPTVRYAGFSGDGIDQLVLDHVRAAAEAGADTALDVAGTTRAGSWTRLLGECRRAKEHLSAGTVTTVHAGPGAEVSLSRSEFEQLVSEPLERFVGAVEEMLQRNGIRSNLAATAIVGGGASIPLITTRLSGRLRVPVLTTPQPVYSAAIGAAVLGQLQSSAGGATAASPIVENPTELVGGATDEMTRAALAARAGDDHPLAWSQDADGAEPVPYAGPEYVGDYGREPTGFGDGDDDRYGAQAARLPWYKRTALVLTVAGALAAVLVAVVLALTLRHTNTAPANAPAPPPTSQTITVTGPNNSPTVTVVPPPPSPSTNTSEAPAPTTTTAPAPTTTTTTPPPTTTTTTSPPPTTTTTTAPPTTTSQATTTAPSSSTSRPRPIFPVFPH
ncbi:Hsp70 family protein [Mycobacterium sp. 663a-19]|uniref:Hsp70 family protein n=1 Tax=Mycobacterium sp. 663a-19 TaxID=2986148 RepID=UPI002D1EF8C9|nr:Hsp70 family protein [Mycobacterium sp. 663a-19]MEB3984319.1 Hsp70 family protein [Mycobacterium sp. 663a-19]